MEVSVVSVSIRYSRIMPPFTQSFRHSTLAKQVAKDNSSKDPSQQSPLPRVAFSKDMSPEVMFEHSLKEHPVACEELVKCSSFRLTEMKARLH